MLLQLLMDMFRKIQILPASNTKTPFLKFTHIQVEGNISQLVYLTPHQDFGMVTVYTK